MIYAFPRFVDKFYVTHVELLGALTEQEQVTEAEQYKVNLMDQVMNFKEGLHNWIAQHETEKEEESEQVRESFSALGPHTAELGQDFPIYTDKVNTHLEAKNKAIKDEIMELSTKQKLEIRNSKLTLQKEQYFSGLVKAKLESKLMLERERHRMVEECKKLNEELNSYPTMGHQLDTKENGSTTHPTTPMYTPGRPEVTSRVLQPQHTPRGPSTVSHELSHTPGENNAASVLADAVKQVLNKSRV
ncbi:hypothetical protein Pmani_013361 [Petrolisthes manimaculis]|uniref:Uncharacterized protein n=1 Tax=Petrolisthes manimaculis TaxID=1843537 RepID=A0AAE1PXH3_9EUCA|nr:hypothetical protein Pmani_013361 [Petrolisthes manimaculis]